MRTSVKSAQSLGLLLLIFIGVGCSNSTSTPLAVPAEGVAPKPNQELLPQNIIDAVSEAKPEGIIVAAFKEDEDGATVYEVEVEMPDGKRYEVEVDTEGKVLEIEKSDGGEGDEGNQTLSLPSS